MRLGVYRRGLKAVFVLLCLLLCRQGVGAEEYAVVVHRDNPLAGDVREMMHRVRQIFLKKRKVWAESCRAKPFARPNDSAVYAAFAQRVLRMSEAQLNHHWAKLKQYSGEKGPRAISSDRVLLRIISKYQGALGVVRCDAVDEDDPNVRVLFTFED